MQGTVQKEFPRPRTHRPQGVTGVEEKTVMRGLGPLLAQIQIACHLPVDHPVGRNLSTRPFRKGREQIHRGRHLLASRSRRYGTGPPGHGRAAKSALPHGTLSTAQRTAGQSPGSSVVGSEEHESILLDSRLADRIKNLPGAPVALLDLSLLDRLGLGHELGSRPPRTMHESMGDEAEERLVLVLLDELHGFLGEQPAELRLLIHVVHLVDHLGASQNRKVGEFPALQSRPHVIGIRNSNVFVEALGGR